MQARGLKEYFPNVVIKLIRPATEAPSDIAKFKIPLSMTKIELKQWLLQLYDVSALKVAGNFDSLSFV